MNLKELSSTQRTALKACAAGKPFLGVSLAMGEQQGRSTTLKSLESRGLIARPWREGRVTARGDAVLTLMALGCRQRRVKGVVSWWFLDVDLGSDEIPAAAKLRGLRG